MVNGELIDLATASGRGRALEILRAVRDPAGVTWEDVELSGMCARWDGESWWFSPRAYAYCRGWLEERGVDLKAREVRASDFN